MAKPKLLYLCHRIPFPPNKGDKIRSFNLLKALAERFDIYLACFVDDPFDWQYEPRLAQWCRDYICVGQHKNFSKVKGLTAFFTDKPITLPYYSSKTIQRWVDKVMREQQPQHLLVFSSAMAQFVDGPAFDAVHKLIDLVDVDSDKWRQYADNHRGIQRFIYQREYQRLAAYEQQCLQRFDRSLLVSDDEAALFRRLSPGQYQHKIHALLNGVDTVFFDPIAPTASAEQLPDQPYLVFTGAMDYWANVDAVCWFVQEVWPTLAKAMPDLYFYIVGGNPSAAVQALKSDRIVVTGRVHDVRPYIANAALVVAPLRIARGIQNKVLEAMSMAKPIVATTMAMEGINAPQHTALQQSDDATVFAKLCLSMLSQRPDAQCNRQWVLDNFTWQATLAPLTTWLASDDPT